MILLLENEKSGDGASKKKRKMLLFDQKKKFPNIGGLYVSHPVVNVCTLPSGVGVFSLMSL